MYVGCGKGFHVYDIKLGHFSVTHVDKVVFKYVT